MLRLPILSVFKLFEHDLTVFDVTHMRNARGEMVIVQGPDRVIRANLQPAGDKIISLLPEGAQSDGLQVLHTTAPIYVADNFNGGQDATQTYIRDGENLWKVDRLQDWRRYSPLGRWLATRYVNTDGTVQ